VLGSAFRANGAFALTLVDRLPADQRAALADEGPDLYGVLLPRAPGLPAKAIDRDTALLYLTLQEPGPLPRYLHALLGPEVRETVLRLVLDGVLEVEHEGAFVCGPQALALIEPAGDAAGGGRIAELSRAALDYAERLELTDVTALAGRLYTYNRLPLTPARQRWEPDLGLATLEATIARRWLPTGTTPWLSWGGPPAAGGDGGTYKLYVSPQPGALADVLPVVVDALAEARASAFKVGAGVEGLLRPDKCVAYFDGFERLAGAAERLRTRLDGVEAHGVPFTAEITRDGLLSWGVDPPGRTHESWRLWVCTRLASALRSGRSTRYALERLRLEGVDPTTWAPSQTIWR